MSSIISVKANKDTTLHVTFEMSQKEFEKLQGVMENISIFADKNATEQSKIVVRGKKDSSKYFLAPKSHRKVLLASNSVPVQVLESKTHYHIIYSTKKYY